MLEKDHVRNMAASSKWSGTPGPLGGGRCSCCCPRSQAGSWGRSLGWPCWGSTTGGAGGWAGGPGGAAGRECALGNTEGLEGAGSGCRRGRLPGWLFFTDAQFYFQ